jgi:basic membrane lipoprotein Med (substrate-binding protein (PBP1-ABC) superfamily)
MTKAVETVDKEFAKVRFMLIDSAVMASKSQKVGFIGGKTTVVDYRERNTCPV